MRVARMMHARRSFTCGTRVVDPRSPCSVQHSSPAPTPSQMSTDPPPRPTAPVDGAEDRTVHCLYIPECADGSLYVGSARNLEHRLEQHNDGKGANDTRPRLPVRVVYMSRRLQESTTRIFARSR